MNTYIPIVAKKESFFRSVPERTLFFCVCRSVFRSVPEIILLLRTAAPGMWKGILVSFGIFPEICHTITIEQIDGAWI